MDVERGESERAAESTSTQGGRQPVISHNTCLTLSPVFVSRTVLRSEASHSLFVLPFFFFFKRSAKAGNVQRGPRSLREHPRCPASGTPKFVNTHRLAETMQQ